MSVRRITKRTPGVLAAATAALAASLVLLTACTGEPAAPDQLTIYATTGHLADAVREIAPEATVTTMVGPGGDPHTYQASTRDIEAMRSADLVVWIGLDLEVQVYPAITSLEDRQLAVGEQIPDELLLDWPQANDTGDPLKDPHIWNDPEVWSLVVELITEEIVDLDPDRADTYRANAQDYRDRIDHAHEQARELLATVPAERRVVVTGHDAFAYFGRAYDFKILATDVISTEAQLSPGEISALADLVSAEQIPVIFRDNQANPQAISSLSEAVRARGWQVEIAEAELYADSLGADPGVDTYLGSFTHNVRTIADALGDPRQGQN